MLSGVRYNYLLKQRLDDLTLYLSQLEKSSNAPHVKEALLQFKKYVDELRSTSSLIDRKKLERLLNIIKDIQENKELAEHFNQAIHSVNSIVMMYQIQASYLQRVEKIHNQIIKEFVEQQNLLRYLSRLEKELTFYEKEKDNDLFQFLKKEPGARIFSRHVTNREAFELIGNEKENISKVSNQIARFLKEFKNEQAFLPDTVIELREQLEKIINHSSDQMLILALDRVVVTIDKILSAVEQFKWEENVDVGYYHFMKTGLGQYIAKLSALEQLHHDMNRDLKKFPAPRKTKSFDKEANQIRNKLQLIKAKLSPEELIRLELFDIRGKSEFDKLMMMMSDNDFNRFLSSFKAHRDEKSVNDEQFIQKNVKKSDKSGESKETFTRAKKGW